MCALVSEGQKTSRDLGLSAGTSASASLRCYWPDTGKSPGPSVWPTSPSTPGRLPETPRGGRRRGTEPWWRRKSMTESSQRCWFPPPAGGAEWLGCPYSPSRLHSTLGAGRPLTRQWNSASWPSATVSSCIWDVPEITGGAGTACTHTHTHTK